MRPASIFLIIQLSNSRVIHIIHIKTCVFGELLTPEKRTDVLVSCDEIKILSKKPDKILDF